jgi:hypothetical protein
MLGLFIAGAAYLAWLILVARSTPAPGITCHLSHRRSIHVVHFVERQP